MMAFLKKFWRPEVGIFLVIWLMLMIGGRSRFFRDPGTFWLAVVGRQMLSSHHLIYPDHFPFPFPGQKWAPVQWSGECEMAVAGRIHGPDGSVIATIPTMPLSCASF